MSSPATREELITDLKEFADQLGKTPTKTELNKYGPHYAKKYQNEFGSWNEALEAADLEPNLVHNISRKEIIGDIERVAGVLAKTPTLTEMETYGKYSRLTYQRKLGSFVATLEELGLEPSVDQYNFSDREKPAALQGTKNVRKVRADGPTPTSELPTKSIGATDKRHGLARFSIKTGQMSQPEAVYYLFGEHEPEDVLRKFFEVNPDIFEHRTQKAISEDVAGHGKKWTKAARIVLSEARE